MGEEGGEGGGERGGEGGLGEAQQTHQSAEANRPEHTTTREGCCCCCLWSSHRDVLLYKVNSPLYKVPRRGDQCSSEFCLGKRVNLICCTNSFLLCLCSTQKKSAAPLSAQPGICKLWEKKSGFRIISDFFAHFSVLVLLTWVGVFCGGKDCDDPQKGAKSCKSQRKKLNLPKIYILRRDSGVLF